MPPTLPLLSPNADALPILEELAEPLARRIYGPIAAAGYNAPRPVLTGHPLPLDVRYSQRNTTLTAALYDHDPLITQDRGLIRAPKSERRKLKDLSKARIDPDLVLVVREIPGTWRPGEPPPRMIGLKTAETARDRQVQHLQVAAAAFVFGRALLYTAGAALAAATGAAVALGTVTIAGVGAVAAAPLAAGLDPILLGGIVHPEASAVAWVPLAAWDEIPDERRW